MILIDICRTNRFCYFTHCLVFSTNIIPLNNIIVDTLHYVRVFANSPCQNTIHSRGTGECIRCKLSVPCTVCLDLRPQWPYKLHNTHNEYKTIICEDLATGITVYMQRLLICIINMQWQDARPAVLQLIHSPVDIVIAATNSSTVRCSVFISAKKLLPLSFP